MSMRAKLGNSFLLSLFYIRSAISYINKKFNTSWCEQICKKKKMNIRTHSQEKRNFNNPKARAKTNFEIGHKNSNLGSAYRIMWFMFVFLLIYDTLWSCFISINQNILKKWIKLDVWSVFREIRQLNCSSISIILNDICATGSKRESKFISTTTVLFFRVIQGYTSSF